MTLSAADIEAIAEAVAARLASQGVTPAPALRARVSRRAAARYLGITPETFRSRYELKGFIRAGSDKRFPRAAVIRLAEKGE